MHVQSCCLANSTNCCFEVLVVVSVVASLSPFSLSATVRSVLCPLHHCATQERNQKARGFKNVDFYKPDLRLVSNSRHKSRTDISPVSHVHGLFLRPHNLRIVVLLVFSVYQVKRKRAYL